MRVRIKFWCHYKKDDWDCSLIPTIDLARLKGEAITCFLNRFDISFYWLFWSIQILFNKDTELKNDKHNI